MRPESLSTPQGQDQMGRRHRLIGKRERNITGVLHADC